MNMERTNSAPDNLSLPAKKIETAMEFRIIPDQEKRPNGDYFY